MKDRMTFIEWCEYAGPAGPGLYLFDQLVGLLSDHVENDGNDFPVGLIVFLASCVAMLGIVLLAGP